METFRERVEKLTLSWENKIDSVDIGVKVCYNTQKGDDIMPRYTYTYKTIFVYWIERGTIQKMPVEIEIPDWKESNHPSFSSRVYSNQQKMELSERFREIFPIAPTFSSEDTVLHVDSPIFKEDKYGMWSYDDDIDKYRKLVSEVIQGEIDNAKNSLKKKENLLLSIA